MIFILFGCGGETIDYSTAQFRCPRIGIEGLEDLQEKAKKVVGNSTNQKNQKGKIAKGFSKVVAGAKTIDKWWIKSLPHIGTAITVKEDMILQKK